MAITIEMDSETGVACGVAHGEFTLAQMKETARTMWGRIDGEARMLWDVREADFDLSEDEVREFADFIHNHSPHGPIRTAFVVEGDLAFGLVRMFGAFRDTGTGHISVFRSRRPAIEWLLLTETAD